MKKIIRWQGLLAFLGVFIIISALWFFFVDGIVKGMIEKYGTKALGARVEVANSDLSFFPAGLELTRLQLTNPDDPMKNAVEISRITLSLDTGNLFRRKIIIDEMALESIRFNTPRKTSGAVVAKPVIAPEASSPESEKEKRNKSVLPSLEIPDVREILKKEELTSIKLAKSIQTDIQSEKNKWQKLLGELPDKKKFTEYKSRINKIKKNKKGTLLGLLGSTGEIADITKEVKQDIKRIKKAQKEFKQEIASLKKRVKELSKTPLEDIKRLKKKYSLSQGNLASISRMLFGDKIYLWSQKAITWYERLKPVLEQHIKKEKYPEVAKPVRGRGVNVRFKEKVPFPDFLIRHVKADVHIPAGNLTGSINNITHQQDILGIPLTFEFSGEKMKDLQSIKIDGTIDHVVPSRSRDRINTSIRGYEVKNVSLSNNAGWQITLKKALVDLDMKTMLEGNNISANLSAGLKSVQLLTSTDSSGATGPLAGAIGSALSGVSKFSANANITGTLDNYDVKIKSDLDRVLKNAVGNVAKNETARLEKELKKAILAKVNGPFNQTKNSLSGFGNIGDELANRLKLGNGLLDISKSLF